MISQELNDLSKKVIGAAIEVHRELGPGLLESVYQKCLFRELQNMGLKVEMEKHLPVIYKGEDIGENFRIDLLVEDRLVIETKAVKEVIDLHKAQTITYLKLSHNKLALIINFNVPLLVKGIKRIVF